MKKGRKTNCNLSLPKRNFEKKKTLENIDLKNSLLFKKYYYPLLNDITIISF